MRHWVRFNYHHLFPSWLWKLEDGGDEMNELFDNFKHDAILHLNRRKLANLQFPVVKLSIRTRHIEFEEYD
jgi:hypothetical protein